MTELPSSPAAPPRKSFLDRSLSGIERVGNALPHPGTLFALMALLIIIASGIASQFNLSVVHPGTGKTIEPVNLLTIPGLHRIMENMVTNFTGFAPLGTVLVAMLGIGIAESSGLIGAALRKLVMAAPPRLLTFVIVFAGVMSNTASEIGYVLLVPLAASIFLAAGRHPLVGLAAAFAGVSGGYSANLLLGTVDPLLSGLSEEAAHIIDPARTVNATANYYFMAVSTFVISITGTWVTEKIVAPRLGEYTGDEKPEDLREMTPAESRGLRWALYTTIAIALLLMMSFVLVSAFINLFMGSASAKWAIMAPVFVPMFMLLGYSPELTQTAYRIGDSTTNIVSPMMTYFALIVAFVSRYQAKAGIGTVIATMLPYTIAFLIVWMLLLIVWMLAGLPTGPGAPLYIPTK